MYPTMRHMSSLDPVTMITDAERSREMFQKLCLMLEGTLHPSVMSSLHSIKHFQCVCVCVCAIVIMYETSRANFKAHITDFIAKS